MPTIQIADKTTLDNTKTNTTNLLTKGGVKYNTTSQKYQTYNTTNNSWVDTEFGGGGSSAPTVVVKNTYHLFDNENVTVSNASFGYTSTKSMSTNDSIVFEVPLCETYTVVCDNITKEIVIDKVGGIICNLFTMPSFASASDEELSMILNAHYNDLLDIADIWAVGDTRIISLSAMTKGRVGETHAAQDVKMAILGFEIDNLTTPINEHTKAAITIGQMKCLKESGYMTYNQGNAGSWNSSRRRDWCNDNYYNALPSGFKSLVKQVDKITASSYNATTNQTGSDYCWLLAAGEVFNTVARPASEGSSPAASNAVEYNALTTYPYYQIASHRYKTVNGTVKPWWERSPYKGDSSKFCYVSSTANAAGGDASTNQYIAPAMCL